MARSSGLSWKSDDGNTHQRCEQDLSFRRQADQRPGPCRSDHSGQSNLHAPGPERLRQDHAAALHRGAGDARRGGDRHRGGHRLVPAEGYLRAAGKSRTQHGVPNLRHLAPHDGLRQCRLSPAGPPRAPGCHSGEGGQDPAIRPAGRLRESSGHQTERRTAAAGGPGPGSGAGAQGDPVRRTPQQPGRQAAGRDPQRVAQLSDPPADHRRLRDPRPHRGPVPLRFPGGDAGRPHRGDRHAQADLFRFRSALRGGFYRPGQPDRRSGNKRGGGCYACRFRHRPYPLPQERPGRAGGRRHRVRTARVHPGDDRPRRGPQCVPGPGDLPGVRGRGV